MDCAEVTIYTDGDGLLSADPRVVENTRLIPRLTYAEAARLSWFGAKVLHPRTLIPVAHRNIPVRVRNTFRPHTRGTVVGPELGPRSAAVAITRNSTGRRRNVSGSFRPVITSALRLWQIESAALFAPAFSPRMRPLA